MKAAKDVGDTGIVIAVDPFIKSAHQLSRNVTMNGLVTAVFGTSVLAKQLVRQSLTLNQDKPYSFSLMQESNADSISIVCVSLDDLCAWEGITHLDYLKIDAEGAEDMILEGGAGR